jgi:hypothetical protein
VLFPLGEALRVERRVLARRPGIRAGSPGFPAPEIERWRPLLEASPTLGGLVDAIHDEARARMASAVAAAHTALATSTVLAGLLVIAIALPAIGQMFDVSPWLLVAAAYAWLGQIAAVRATGFGRRLRVGLDALAEPIERAQKAHGEQSRGVLLAEARALRALAAEHDAALAECIEAFVAAATGSVRNALVALAVWLLLNAVPQSLAAAWRGIGWGVGG